MKESIVAIVATMMEVPVETVTLETGPDSVAAWDSLRHMKLILAVEEEFEITFSDQHLTSIQNVATLLDAVTSVTKA